MFSLFIFIIVYGIIFSMKKVLATISILLILFINPVYAFDFQGYISEYKAERENKSVERFFEKQANYANRTNFKKFISTYDDRYISADGFDKKVFSEMIKDIWTSYKDLEYKFNIKKITVQQDKAIAELVETSFAEISMTDVYKGELKSESDTIYYLERDKKGDWKIVKDEVLAESTSMLYGAAKGMDVKLVVPESIASNTDYLATLEFTPPKDTFAIASIAADKVEYPQKPTKEVFRVLPEDNILERFFTSNDEDVNEYVVASIGLTKTSIDDLSLNLKLTGFGYAIKRVNLIDKADKECLDDKIK